MRTIKVLSLSILIISSLIGVSVASGNVFTIENGQVEGESLDGYIALRGIPYAEPPVGDLRFAPPKKFEQKWDGVREFKKYGDVCAQYDHFEYAFEGSEDCLTMNVFVPEKVLESKKKVPVIFHVHGL